MDKMVKRLIGSLLLTFCVGFFYLYSYICLEYIGVTTYLGQYVFLILYYAILIGTSIYFLNNDLKIEFIVQCIFCLTFGSSLFISFINGFVNFVYVGTGIDVPEKVCRAVDWIGQPFVIFFSDFAMLLAVLSAYIPLIILIGKIRFWVKKENLLKKDS